ncbi:RagB/SusD family nutrient uptake outer membrane protein [Galbibacter sp. EGI 63066]|uniref:RagB/SusD family nutrient uptake outer membrane protein n=1 Tax=Galbibacter sp. EGI 63066 TaxID=2993559 RepID=UPI002248A807|nr:RagB/SusD family nutrient uptake outer membrane protein [Galbibacter sp. EGI 63066]MCX2679486.1 RagB/SusD family nutrient uptake outer membrane protein [Galbibacter sp. EGI 63066]
MKKYIYILMFSSALLACDDELEQVNPNVVTQENFWKTENDVLSGLAATYKMFRHIDNGYWGVRGVELTNGRGDDFFIRNDVKALYELSTFTNNPSTGTPSSMFTGAYTGIFRANQILDNIETVEISDAEKEAFIAEAKFLRGLNYFHLAINFGAVPIFTTVPQTREDYFVAQSPEEAVWEQVENDFKAAAAALPVTYPSEWVGRATKGAAIGYLGKAYLYQEKWTEAEAQFAQLTGTTGAPKAPYNYDLLPNYEDNFVAGNDNNIESLFEIQNQNVGGTNPWAGENADESQGVTTAQEFAPTEVGGWFEAFPTEKIFNEFQKEKTVEDDFDPRMYASLVWDYPGAEFYNIPYTEISSPFGHSSRIRKYQNWRDDDEGIWISEINEKALRFADILLMYAEALTMQGRTTEAYPFVNRIRERANLADLAAGMGQDALMEEIRHQRMIEFFREGFRFYDLKRWGLIGEEIENSDKVGKEFLTLPKHEYFPIPQGEMNTNPEIEQNPNW